VVTTAKCAGAVHTLREAGLVVEDVVCVVDREEGGRENLERKASQGQVMVKSSELLGYKPNTIHFNPFISTAISNAI
jgi:orotate phosphoribosyltransferase